MRRKTKKRKTKRMQRKKKQHTNSGVTMAKDTIKLNGELYDDTTGKTLKAHTQFVNGKIMIHVEGYGDSCSDDGLGEPVIIDFFDNKVQVIVWGDINRQDPTHNIDLKYAKESLRSKEIA
jgi:phage protein U